MDLRFLNAVGNKIQEHDNKFTAMEDALVKRLSALEDANAANIAALAAHGNRLRIVEDTIAAATPDAAPEDATVQSGTPELDAGTLDAPAPAPDAAPEDATVQSGTPELDVGALTLDAPVSAEEPATVTDGDDTLSPVLEDAADPAAQDAPAGTRRSGRRSLKK